jgi:hypothetical protein
VESDSQRRKGVGVAQVVEHDAVFGEGKVRVAIDVRDVVGSGVSFNVEVDGGARKDKQ